MKVELTKAEPMVTLTMTLSEAGVVEDVLCKGKDAKRALLNDTEQDFLSEVTDALQAQLNENDYTWDYEPRRWVPVS